MDMCRAVLFADTSVKLPVYVFGVIVVSVIGDVFDVPETLMSDRDNLLNEYFIKLGWGWTLFFVSIYIVLTTRVYCNRDYFQIIQHLARLAVGTFWWYLCTSGFIYVGSQVGDCSEPQFHNKKDCVDAGYFWHGFDISGHVFLETHCLLVISEELKTFKEWKKLRDILHDHEDIQLEDLSEHQLLQARKDYKTLTPYIKVVMIIIAVMVALLEFMLFISSIYRFHTISQKVLASQVAVVCWFLSYQVLFQTDNSYPFLPVMPGMSGHRINAS